MTLRNLVRGETDQQTMKYQVGTDTRNQMHGAPMTSRAEWEAGTLVVRSVAVIMSRGASPDRPMDPRG